MSIDVAWYRLASMGTLIVACVDRVESLRSIVASLTFEEREATSVELQGFDSRGKACRLYSERARGRLDSAELSALNSRDI
jgi:hypothetical protein